eukprot:729602-Pelagomonas_calceolata.AAC.4
MPGGAQGVGPEIRQNACQSGVLRKLTPASLTSGDGLENHQEHIQDDPGGGVKKIALQPHSGRENGK